MISKSAKLFFFFYVCTLEKVVIGSMYVVLGIILSALNIPCLYVLYTDKDMWKNSCIKVV
jgi:hypothetical protein